MKKCISNPVSWLTLEQRALGELSGAQAMEVEKHLEGCEACREAAAEIPAVSSVSAGPAKAEVHSLAAFRKIVAIGGVVALAASVLFYFAKGATNPEASERSKGSNVALRVELEIRSDGSIPPSARAKLLVTCPRGAEGPWDIAVVEGGQVSYPLEEVPGLACGNEVPYPASLILTGYTPIDVCVVHGKGVGRATAQTAESIVASGACMRVTPNRL